MTWSSWVWPAATAALGFVYVALLLAQWLKRRKPHQLAWAVGFLFYAVAAVIEAYSEYTGTLGPDRLPLLHRAGRVDGRLPRARHALPHHQEARLGPRLPGVQPRRASAIFLYGAFTTELAHGQARSRHHGGRAGARRGRLVPAHHVAAVQHPRHAAAARRLAPGRSSSSGPRRSTAIACGPTCSSSSAR